MKRIISMLLSITIILAGITLPVTATSRADIENLTFSGNSKVISWNKAGADYAGANVYKYNADGSIQKLCFTQNNSYTYSEDGTYIVRPVTKDNTILEGKVITTVAPESSINIGKVSTTNQGVYTVNVENITGHYLRCKALVEFLDENDTVIKYSYGKAFIAPDNSKDFKFVMVEPEGTARTSINIYDDLGNSLANLDNDVYQSTIIATNRANTAEIKGLLAQCEAQGIPTDYETVNYKVMERFSTYLQEDFANDRLDNIYYLGTTLNELYKEAKENLTAYLAGEKVAQAVPRYITSDMRIDGSSVYAQTDLNGVTSERPVFFIGYGHFGQAVKDMPLFNAIGANTIQTEIGPTDVIVYSDYDSWEFYEANAPTYTAGISNENAYEGEGSLKITYNSPLTDNQFISYSQYVPVKPGKTYNFTGYVDTTNTTNAWMSLNDWDDRIQIPANSGGWKKITATYTAPADATGTTVRFNCDAYCDAWYLDNVTFTEAGSSVNLLQGGGFNTTNTSDYQMNANAVKLAELENILQDAEDNNIAVSVLLSPHYFPQSIIDKYGIGHNDSASTFLKYNVNADIAKQVIEDYLRLVVPRIKDYTSLNNICISNEPLFKPESCGDFYLDRWHQFLKDKYGSTWDLYQAYGKYYISFNKVPLDPNGSDAKEYDYKVFNDMIFSEWHKWMADIVHELAPDVPVHSKIMAYVDDNDTAGRMKRGVGYESYYSFFDLNGCDAHNYINDGSGLYLVDDGYHVEEMWYDYMRSIKNVPVANLEDHIIPDRSTNYSDDVADYVAQNMYMGAIHGRAISDIWVWERSYDESSDFYGSVLHRPDVIAAIGKETLNLNRNAYEITALQNADKNVGILYSDSSILFDTSASFAMYQAYAACLYSGQAVQFVTPSQLSKMNNCKVLIVPQATNVTAETLDYIKNYIANGGKVIMIGQNSLKKNEIGENNDSDKYNYILNNSTVISYNGTSTSTGSISQAALYDAIRNVLTSAGIYNVVIKDAATGEVVDYVEYNVGKYNGKTIVNLISYEKDMNVKIYINDSVVASSYDINNNVALGETISLKRYDPITVRVGN